MLGAGTALVAAHGLGVQPALGAAPSGPPIRWLVAFPAGGGSDILSRLVAKHVGERLEKNIVVENKPGGATIIATQTLLSAPADGHTVMLGNDALAANPSLYGNLPYDVGKDLEFVAMIARIPMVLVVRADFPAKTPKEVLDHMVRSQSKATYATWGVGSISHLTMEALNERQGIKLTHVPYQGTVAALKDMVSGLVDFMFADMPVSLQLIRAGKLRAVAVPAGQRSPAFPGIPTIAELGFDGFDFFSWQGLIARKGTPAAAAEKLSAAIQDIMRTPQMAQELAERGMEAWPAPPARFREQVLNDTAKMRAIITQRGITLG